MPPNFVVYILDLSTMRWCINSINLVHKSVSKLTKLRVTIFIQNTPTRCMLLKLVDKLDNKVA